ncbi:MULTISPECIES: thioredoxin domain-containing protein [Spirulina sp. CCY15215]|uniref:thioredoxin domain-containing protein n=1 Tax=Spirulina sp. CCY15215 TaxID=2767591 RepID=UPI001950B5F9
MTNRLSQSESLYLRKHAENPIDWWPWCEEALNKAKTEDKPIFLSIGYSSCHWCTVMEGEAFSNEAIAHYMNANFVPIKVDREERPDIDSIYMQALQAMTGQGGWPLNIFLTPGDRIPFYGGTYFPVEPRFGRPGFIEVLQGIQNFYQVEKEKLQGVTQEMFGLLQRSTLLPQAPKNILTDALLQTGIETSSQIIDRKDMGSPSFPMIPYADLVVQGSRFPSQEEAKIAAKQRGDDLASGGIYDHVAGGFHRYTVDATWTVPHFEKMLYDNGQILDYLASLWNAGMEEPAYLRAVEGTIAWLQREMVSPQGYFYAAQDADSFATPEEIEPEEGAFCVWKYAELEQLLDPAELAALQADFTVSSTGNFEGNNVLQRRSAGKLSEMSEKALSRLFLARYGESLGAIDTFPPARDNQEAKTKQWKGRIPAVTDTKMIVAWNSLMISGLARVYQVFKNPIAWELAKNATQFILKHQWIEGRFHRLNYEGKARVLAQSEDYALFIKALLDCDRASAVMGETGGIWREEAIRVQEEFDEFLWSLEMGGYYNAPMDASEDLLIRERSYIDNATPAANGIAAANLVRLGLLTDNTHYLEQAEAILQAFSPIMEQSPQACPSLFLGLDWYLHSTLIRTTGDRVSQLAVRYFPKSVYQVEEKVPEDAIGLICKGLACLPTAHSWEQLLTQIEKCHGIAEISR